jgi:hypothetical protein
MQNENRREIAAKPGVAAREALPSFWDFCAFLRHSFLEKRYAEAPNELKI